MTIISSQSREYLRYWVKAKVDGLDYNPTSDNVEFACPVAGGTPTVWVDGVWEEVEGSFFALGLIGPGTGMALSAGEYDVYIRITDSPEIPVKKVDRLKIT